MCLGIPMQVIEINGFNARCTAKGVERDVSLFMMQHEPVEVGEFIMVHVGYAIQKMSEAEALSTWDCLTKCYKRLRKLKNARIIGVSSPTRSSRNGGATASSN